jgi:hypothetical protein
LSQEVKNKRPAPFPEEDNGEAKPPEQTSSYTMVDPRLSQLAHGSSATRHERNAPNASGRSQ